MFFALCLLTAACADAEKPPKGAVTLIYMIGDGLGLAQVSMPVIGGGYVPKAFDRAQGAALIRTRRLTVRRGFVPQPEFRLRFFCLFEGLCYLCLRYGFPVPLRSPGIKREYRENR